MSIEQQIADIEALVKADAHIKDLTERMAKERGELEGVRSEVGGLETRLSSDRTSITEMEKTRGDLVQELRQIGNQIERSRDRLQRSRNERESNAAERELDELRKLQRDRDDEVRRLATLADDARKSAVEGEQRIGELSQRLEGSLPGATKTIEELEAALAAARQHREEAVSKLPTRLYRRYESVSSRGRTPVAKTHDGTCLGCFVQLPPMLFHQMLSRTEFGECPFCHRIIYYAPKPEPGESDDASASDQTSNEASS